MGQGAAAFVGIGADLHRLLAKIVLTTVLVTLGWYNRTRWYGRNAPHRISAEVSRLRSGTELSVMAGAVALGAALAVTG